MRRLGGSAIWLILPLCAVAVFAVLLSFSLIRMIEVEADMRVEAERNMLWVMHQSEVAARRLVQTALAAELGEADADEIALRFDILKSRIALLNDGPQRRFLDEIGLGGDLDRLTAALGRIAPLIEGFARGDGAELRAALAPFPRFFGRAANRTMIAEWDDLGGRLETYRDQLQKTIASLIGIMVAGGVLTVALIMALRQSRQRNLMLRRARDFSGLLISSSGEGILAVDEAGCCTLWNGAMAEMVGQPAEQAVGRMLTEVAGFFDIAVARRGVALALAGETSQLTLQKLFREGREAPLHVDLRFFPMRNEGRIVGAIAFMRDASDRHAARQRNAETRDRLEQLVTERTRELDEALKRERSAADLYRNFAAMISHQFRTPLAVADSALQRLIRRGARADAGEVVERAVRARDAIAGLTRLVESTLDAARLEAGQVGARREQCDLAGILRSVLVRQRAASPDARIEVDVEGEIEGGCAALCDPAHAEQVLGNLLSNAVKYAAPGSAVLVRLHGDAGSIHCDIRNAGASICAADRERIFERNVRGANSVGSPGTGVGLFVARALARMQGGDVTLLPCGPRSDGGPRLSRDSGTAFRLTLPRAEGAPR